MISKQQFKSYHDPGHGWVAVKRDLLVKLGIANDITPFSFERGNTVYLEEDCDVATFHEAYKKKMGYPPEYLTGKYSERSPVRSYKNYKAQETQKMENDICIVCAGSGEGNHDGSICSRCKGSGESSNHYEIDDDYQDYDYSSSESEAIEWGGMGGY